VLIKGPCGIGIGSSLLMCCPCVCLTRPLGLLPWVLTEGNGRERPYRHHRDVPPDHLRTGGRRCRSAARPYRRTAAAERADGEPAPPVEADLVRVDEVARRGGGDVIVRRIAEHVQLDPDMMAELKSVGVMPGNTVKIGHSPEGEDIPVTGEGNTAELAPQV